MFKAKPKFNLLRIPQVFSILYISLLTILSLNMPEGNISLIISITSFIIRMAPILILILFLYLSFQRPYLGGFLYIIAGICITISLQSYNTLSTFLAVSLPIFTIGILFIIFGIMEKYWQLKTDNWKLIVKVDFVLQSLIFYELHWLKNLMLKFAFGKFLPYLSVFSYQFFYYSHFSWDQKPTLYSVSNASSLKTLESDFGVYKYHMHMVFPSSIYF